MDEDRGDSSQNSTTSASKNVQGSKMFLDHVECRISGIIITKYNNFKANRLHGHGSECVNLIELLQFTKCCSINCNFLY